MKNIAVVLSYDGTNFNGWQIQKNGPSIQESMEDAIFHLLKQKVHVSGVGRTDSGVHARRYVANFHADCTIPMDRLPYALNSFLPEDIAVSGAVEVPEDFDARFNCTKKEYAYYLFPSTLRDPFHARYAYRYNYPLDITKMQEGAQYFVGKQDFASVSYRHDSCTEYAAGNPGLDPGSWCILCNHRCKTALRWSGTELHEPGTGSQMFPSDFLRSVYE